MIEMVGFTSKKGGKELSKNRYASVEPFYNGFALVETSNGNKQIIDEARALILKLGGKLANFLPII